MKVVVFIFWTVICLYFCIGGITNILILKKFEEAQNLPLHKDIGVRDKNNNFFRNISELNANEDYEKMTSFYPMFETVGDTFSYIIILMSFGILGTIIKSLIQITFGKGTLVKQYAYTLPILGALLGLLVLVLSEMLPEFKYKSGNDKLFYGSAMLAGLYTEEFFIWLEKKFSTALHKKVENDVKNSGD